MFFDVVQIQGESVIPGHTNGMTTILKSLSQIHIQHILVEQ